MTDNVKESLSGLMDGEVSEIELHRLLRHVGDDDLRKSWSAYQQIRSVMRNEPLFSAQQHLDLSRQISSAVDQDTEFEISKDPLKSNSHRYIKPLGGLAVAASFALAGFIGFQQYSSTAEDELNQLVEEKIETNSRPNAGEGSLGSPQEVETQLAENNVLDPEIEEDLRALPPEKQKRLREYLLRTDRPFGPQTRTVIYKKKKDK